MFSRHWRFGKKASPQRTTKRNPPFKDSLSNKGTHSHTILKDDFHGHHLGMQPSPFSKTLGSGKLARDLHPLGMQENRCSSDATTHRMQVCDHFQTISYMPSYFEYCIIPPRTWLISSTLHSLQTGKLFVRNLCFFAKTVSARKGL